MKYSAEDFASYRKDLCKHCFLQDLRLFPEQTVYENKVELETATEPVSPGRKDKGNSRTAWYWQ